MAKSQALKFRVAGLPKEKRPFAEILRRMAFFIISAPEEFTGVLVTGAQVL